MCPFDVRINRVPLSSVVNTARQSERDGGVTERNQ